jgi:hypothetical protein
MSDPGAGAGVSRMGASEGSLARASPKPSAHQSTPSQSSLTPLNLTPGGPGPGPVPVPAAGSSAESGSPVKGVGSSDSLAPLRVLVVDDDCTYEVHRVALCS